MNSNTSIALAIGAGYLLGRTRKMRWALLLGAAAASGRLNSMPGELLQKGTKALGSSPEFSKLGGSAEKLLDAGKAAATTALSSRMESLGDMLNERAQALGAPVSEAGEQAREKVDGGRRKLQGAAQGESEEAEDEYDEDEGPDDEYDEEEDESPESPEDEESPESPEDEDDEDEADEDENEDEEEEEEEEPQPAARGRGSGSGSVVRRRGGQR